MAYIISVNSTVVSASGGTCVCPPEGMADLCDTNTEYMLCVQEVRRDLVTATAAISALCSFAMGLFANMPIALAPGMGVRVIFLRWNIMRADLTSSMPTLPTPSSGIMDLVSFPTASPSPQSSSKVSSSLALQSSVSANGSPVPFPPPSSSPPVSALVYT